MQAAHSPFVVLEATSIKIEQIQGRFFKSCLLCLNLIGFACLVKVKIWHRVLRSAKAMLMWLMSFDVEFSDDHV